MRVCTSRLYLILRWTQVHGSTRGSSVSPKVPSLPDHHGPDIHTFTSSLILTRHSFECVLTSQAVQLLSGISLYILGAKVRSRALLFLYKLFFQLVYHVFYRNLVSLRIPALVRFIFGKGWMTG